MSPRGLAFTPRDRQWNPSAHDRRVLPYARVGRAIPSGPHSYVVIMTPDHRADEVALRQLVRKRLRYLGVLGSARKAREMLDRLRATGCPPECLGRVHTPVGLPIASHTPAEIAISIAAQLIQERNRQDPPESLKPKVVADSSNFFGETPFLID